MERRVPTDGEIEGAGRARRRATRRRTPETAARRPAGTALCEERRGQQSQPTIAEQRERRRLLAEIAVLMRHNPFLDTATPRE